MEFQISEKADPLMRDEVLVDEISGFVQVLVEKRFYLDYSQYIELVRSSYNSISMIDAEFPKYICFSAFQYYCVILLWKRLYSILSKRGLKTLASNIIDEHINFELLVPFDIKLYLEGIGDLKCTADKEAHIALQGTLIESAEAGAHGSFGPMNENNFIIYETLPSPLIALLKIKADILVTLKEGSVLWDLPKWLRPTYSHATNPTRNLLCWWPGEHLISTQMKVLQDTGVHLKEFGYRDTFGANNIDYLPINLLLLKLITDRLKFSKVNAVDILGTSRFGSGAQICFTTRDLEDVEVDNMKNIAGKLGRTNSCIEMPRNIASAAATFRYRMKRRENYAIDMVAYEFSSNDVPMEILRNENLIFEFEMGKELWNKSNFRIPEHNGSHLVSLYSMKTVTSQNPR